MSENPGSSEKPAGSPRCLCPLDGVMDLLSRKYAMQVVCVVGALQPARYGDIEEAFGEVSSSTLSARLGELTEAGLLDRDQHDTIPPRVEYRLTDDGAELHERLEPLVEWAERRD
ncbi:winged helix-turn-helix transcriptional regulator [Halorarius halobius]|uniref:winged helix-turn-helix transcriptional regulator n=1 Tax=Halorarius halobius TaxID=2962671 RepID=UPI0020CFA4C1|nr:helix-turn-helix domain-containing protein [Halorarius halobius]